MTREEARGYLFGLYVVAHDGDDYEHGLNEALDIAIEALSAEAEPKVFTEDDYWKALSADRPMGEWVFGHDDETKGKDLYAWTCSLCGGKYPWQPNYCPNCGARMKGGDDE